MTNTPKPIVGALMLRAQPLHSGHKDLIRKARKKCDTLLLLIGSANSPRTIRNPFTYQEREIQICRFLEFEFPQDKNFVVYPLNDYRYSDSQWMSDVEMILSEYPEHEPVIFGHMKEGNEYLKWFKQFRYENVDSDHDIAATGIREHWFNTARHNFDPSVLEDYDYFEKEKLLFGNYPFPETLSFNCADVILECSGHVLLIQRGRPPGKGTWAFPGGFKERNETFLGAGLRELEEETNVRVSRKVLEGSIVSQRLFDSPNRGMGIPRITLAIHIRVQPDADGSLPRANGGDDAMLCKWVPIKQALNDMALFDDHSDILSEMTGVKAIPAHTNQRYMFWNF